MEREKLRDIEEKVYSYYKLRLKEEYAASPNLPRGTLAHSYLSAKTKVVDGYLNLWSGAVEELGEWRSIYSVLKDDSVMKGLKEKNKWETCREKAPKLISFLELADRVAKDVREKYGVDLELSPEEVFSRPEKRISEKVSRSDPTTEEKFLGVDFYFRTKVQIAGRRVEEVVKNARLCIDAMIEAWKKRAEGIQQLHESLYGKPWKSWDETEKELRELRKKRHATET